MHLGNPKSYLSKLTKNYNFDIPKGQKFIIGLNQTYKVVQIARFGQYLRGLRMKNSIYDLQIVSNIFFCQFRLANMSILTCFTFAKIWQILGTV